MARITVEDCIKLINNQYDLVILAKERAVQLGRGATPSVDPENDKKPVIALREISESKITADELKESIIAKLRQIPDYEEEEELEEVDNDTFRQMYQGGLSKSEMEKSATRKFTARSPRVESRAKPIEEVVQSRPASDEMAPSDDELSKVEQVESLSMEQESEVQEMQAVKDEVVEHEGMNEDVVSEELNETSNIDQDLNEHSNSHEDEVPVPNEEENSKE
ncbi:DNA-directed RNA polymerase subunit omega [Pelagibacteraceae bacterium]|nr:DNA-directed RNA polymerase subunit omega [Pelagibacteraceae bacterium]